ncbi:flagellar hook-length control protein FliK [Nitrogeniibacter mangrovi]|uniref:Flagellar hook-length control protein FliK n=1 Tax=Nitrogeniibacter mangrovi TaxID=2016596 RepID=A0A6C1B2W0_9RHOO|nr:flagellar hook-length control protein FliK [Nitrogeniibacter mangrovi]QID17319.1 flagellar hook-length control protein FliK [Nitrogeniibacter mangrovi]
MIPGDLAARLRLLTEASFFSDEPPLEPLKGARPIPADLPQFRPGDRLTAQIQRALPDGTFEGVVDGKTIKLALAQQARPGDILDLVVARQTPRAVIAQPAGDPAATAQAANAGARPSLSPTGQLISFLLTGQPAPEAARLAGGQPLVSAGNVVPQNLAPALQQAVSESGLFYEAQQARWMAGKVPTDTLLRQPQGQLSTVATAPDPGAFARSGAAQPAANTWTAQMQEATATALKDAGGANAAATAARSPVAERLMPVVHQQLDALATHHYVWHGQAWPGQPVELEIEDPPDGREGADEPIPWKTTLRLTLPELGGVEARLELDRSGIRIRLSADSAESVRSLNTGRSTLASALEAANVPLKNLHVSLRDGRTDT